MRKRDEPEAGQGAEGPAEVRLDVFLDVSCLFPTRSQAKAACEGGKVDVNGASARANRALRVGDTLQITFPGRRRTFVVRALAEKNLPKAVARTLYEETTPAPSAEALEARRIEKLLFPGREAGGKLSHRERRERDRLRRG